MPNDPALTAAVAKVASAIAELMAAMQPPAPRPEPKAKPATADDSLLIDDKEAARRMNLSRKTLFNLRTNENLPHVMVGAKVMYCPQKLAAWIEAQAKK